MSSHRAVFLGSKAFGLAIFRVLVATTPNVLWTVVHPDDSHDQRGDLHNWHKTAHDLGCNFFISSSKAETRELIRSAYPDIAFVCGWYELLDDETLAAVPQGYWGIHNSLLPKYRGSSPLVWSIINGDSVVGSTVFKLAEGIDSGGVLLQIRVQNHPNDCIGSILGRIESSLVQELPAKWLSVLEARAELLEQREVDATYCGGRTDEDGLIDWTKNAKRVHDFVRAQSTPYPGGFTYLKGERLRILKTRISPATFFGTPGQILSLHPVTGAALVACGHGSALEVLEVKLNDRVTSATDVLTSNTLRLQAFPSTVQPVTSSFC